MTNEEILQLISEDQILSMADKIKVRRKNKLRLESFYEAKRIMIRWDVPGSAFGESYVSIDVSSEEVSKIVEDFYKDKI